MNKIFRVIYEHDAEQHVTIVVAGSAEEAIATFKRTCPHVKFVSCTES